MEDHRLHPRFAIKPDAGTGAEYSSVGDKVRRDREKVKMVSSLPLGGLREGAKLNADRTLSPALSQGEREKDSEVSRENEMADRMSALHLDDAGWIHTTNGTEASEHHGARGWCSVLCSLSLWFPDRSRAVLSCLSGWFHLLDWNHSGKHGALDVAASDGRRVGTDTSPRAGGGVAHSTPDADSVFAYPARVESDL